MKAKSLDDILKMLPVKNSVATVDFLAQRNEEREYIERYVPGTRRAYAWDDATNVNPITGEPEE